MNNLEYVQNLIEQKLPGSKVRVSDMTGTLDHLHIEIGADQFKGKMMIEQHQIIMNILKEDLKERIHAVQLKTMTLDKWNE